MNFPFFIAKGISFSPERKNSIASSVLKLATGAVALGIAIMIVSVAIVTGFQGEIHKKVIGFMAHISVHNLDMNFTHETLPISRKQPFNPNITNINGIKHIQIYATKPGIIKTQDEIQGIIMKGIGPNYNWSFLEKNIVEGEKFIVQDTIKTKKILISKYIASLLNLKINEKLIVYFVNTTTTKNKTQQPRPRDFIISGIYETGFEDFDKNFIFCDIKHIQKIEGWLGKDEKISGFEIFINNENELDKMTKIVENEVLSIINEDGSMLTVSNYQKDYPLIFDWLSLTDMNVKVILLITFIVAAFNMISGLLVIIIERTGMIGILKSLGANNSTIKKIFLYNGTIIAIKGIVVGNLIALLLLFLQKYFGIMKLNPATYYVSTVPVKIDFLNILFINLGVIGLTFLVLLLPAMAISRINPTTAIKFN